jgi:hypothetical protein
MSQAEKTKELLRKTFGEPSDGPDMSRMDERILLDASTSLEQAVTANRWIYRVPEWRKVMKTKSAILATAAAVLVAAFVLTTLDRSAGTAWSVEQTIAAIERLRTVQVRGTAIWGPTTGGEVVNFNFWIQPPEGESPLKMRFECEKRIIVVQGNAAYECWPDEKVEVLVRSGRIDPLADR